MRVLRTADGLDPLIDIAVGPALLARAVEGSEPVLRIGRPAPTLAFSRLDTLAVGLPTALAAAHRHGFEPVVRARGGRAAAYHEGCLLLDVVSADPDARLHIRDRFETLTAALVDALQELGVEAGVGAVEGEYCPGDHSINAGGRVKLVGTAQRVVRGASLVSAMVVVRDAEPLRAVLVDVYAALRLDWDPATVGAVTDLVDVGGDGVERAVLAAVTETLAAPGSVAGYPPDEAAAVLAEAEALHDRHRVPEDA